MRFANRRIKVTGCNDCARINMAKWSIMYSGYAGKSTKLLLSNLKPTDD